MSAVVSIRVRREVKELMSSVKIDWRREIEEFILKRALEERRKELLAKMSKNMKGMREIDNSQIVREERERA